jgi:hypothetical protein
MRTPELSPKPMVIHFPFKIHYNSTLSFFLFSSPKFPIISVEMLYDGIDKNISALSTTPNPSGTLNFPWTISASKKGSSSTLSGGNKDGSSSNNPTTTTTANNNTKCLLPTLSHFSSLPMFQLVRLPTGDICTLGHYSPHFLHPRKIATATPTTSNQRQPQSNNNNNNNSSALQTRQAYLYPPPPSFFSRFKKPNDSQQPPTSALSSAGTAAISAATSAPVPLSPSQQPSPIIMMGQHDSITIPVIEHIAPSSPTATVVEQVKTIILQEERNKTSSVSESTLEQLEPTPPPPEVMAFLQEVQVESSSLSESSINSEGQAQELRACPETTEVHGSLPTSGGGIVISGSTATPTSSVRGSVLATIQEECESLKSSSASGGSPAGVQSPEGPMSPSTMTIISSSAAAAASVGGVFGMDTSAAVMIMRQFDIIEEGSDDNSKGIHSIVVGAECGAAAAVESPQDRMMMMEGMDAVAAVSGESEDPCPGKEISSLERKVTGEFTLM